MALDDVMLASASTASQFEPPSISFREGTKQFFGGSTFAESTDMYAYLQTVWSADGIKPENAHKIAIVSIGSQSFKTAKIGGEVGLLGWASRLYDLTGPVKKMTQDYMALQLTRKHGSLYKKFLLETTEDWSLGSLFWNEDLDEIESKANSMINDNK